MDTSMLDGYLAALASGANLVIPDQMLRWVWDTETGTVVRQNTQLGRDRHSDAQSRERMHHQAPFGKSYTADGAQIVRVDAWRGRSGSTGAGPGSRVHLRSSSRCFSRCLADQPANNTVDIDTLSNRQCNCMKFTMNDAHAF